MSIETRGQQYGRLLGDWTVGKLLGHGSGGRSAVFLMYRDGSDWREYCALKVVSLIQEQGVLQQMPRNMVEEYSTTVQHHKEKAETEVRLMAELRGKTNIVDYLDHRVVNWREDNAFGMDLLIRMELLKDLRSQIRQGEEFREAQIIAIGKDICRALILCHSKHILHRDIKPENIFYNQDGDYKLGDFGISRILSATTSSRASTSVGTMAYCAPEQIGSRYDHRVDIYSLGLVLYELANRSRLPFAETRYVTGDAIEQRLLSERLPNPSGSVSYALKQVILKACARNPQNRYQTAEELYADLERVGNGTWTSQAENHTTQTEILPPDDDTYTTVPPEVKHTTPPVNNSNQTQSNSTLMIALILLVCLLIGILLGRTAKANTQPSDSDRVSTSESPFPDAGYNTETDDNNEASNRDTVPNTDNRLASLDIGDTFAFGEYEQDGNTGNGSEGISWTVLDKRDGKLLVVGTHGIACRKYHNSNESVSWENSDLRSWLNSSFYQEAFDSGERQLILNTAISESGSSPLMNSLAAGFHSSGFSGIAGNSLNLAEGIATASYVGSTSSEDSGQGTGTGDDTGTDTNQDRDAAPASDPAPAQSDESNYTDTGKTGSSSESGSSSGSRSSDSPGYNVSKSEGFLVEPEDHQEQDLIIQDKLFLLSLEEVEKYLPTDSSRICWATRYAIDQGAYVNDATGGSWWLLRTPGQSSKYVMSVNADGSIDFSGGKVTSSRGVVRPAMWLRAD